MTNPGVSFDTSLIQAGSQSNASIAGVPLRINPNSVSLGYKMKMSQTQTVGGFVFQIFGVIWSDLVVEGQFGVGGWPAQLKFFQFLQGLVSTTVADQRIQGAPGNSIEPSGSFRFFFPLLGYDFMVFLKSFDSTEGQAVELFNENINPSWRLTFTIDNDNSNLTKVAVDQYIARLQAGLGYEPNAYNGPTASSTVDLQTFLQNYMTQANSLNQAFSGAFGTSPSDSSSTTGSSSSGSMIGNTPAQQAFNYLANNGLTKVQAAAFVGNWQYESGGKWATANEGPVSGQGQGIAQWSFNGRWVACCKMAGTPHVTADAPGAPTLAQQLAYALSEIKGGYSYILNQTKDSTNVADVTTIVQDEYEVPADLKASLPARIANAQAALAQWGSTGA